MVIALLRLALHIDLAGLAVGIERVEFEVECVFGRFAGVDRAAKDFSFGGRHRCAFAWSVETQLPCRCQRSVSGCRARLPAGSCSISFERLAPLRSPKKRGPLQAVPVMARAMVERLA